MPPPRDSAAPGSDARLRKRLWHKAGTEFGPLLLFFIANAVADIFWATAVFMAATTAAAAFAWRQERRLPLVPLISLLLIMILGGMTLATDNPIWILVRPTIMNGVPGLLLLASLAIRRPGMQMVLGRELRLTDRGWRGLTLHVSIFLLLLALVNEAVWRTFGVDVWVAYKAFAFIPINVAFIFSQYRYVQRHRKP